VGRAGVDRHRRSARRLCRDGLKAIVDRPRPFVRYPDTNVLVSRPHDASFPSGHAATSFAAATILSFAFPKAAPAFLVVAAAVAFSRVYVGVHTPSTSSAAPHWERSSPPAFGG